MEEPLPLGNFKRAPAKPQQLAPKLVAAFALGELVFGKTGRARVRHLHRRVLQTTGEPSLLGRQKRSPALPPKLVPRLARATRMVLGEKSPANVSYRE